MDPRELAFHGGVLLTSRGVAPQKISEGEELTDLGMTLGQEMHVLGTVTILDPPQEAPGPICSERSRTVLEP
jgi:hypothetical protein